MKPRDTVWNKPFRNQICNLCRLYTRTYQLFQNGIIPCQHGHDLSSVRPAELGHLIIMTVLALLATELLVRPSILYLVTTLKADRHSLFFSHIFHNAHDINATKSRITKLKSSQSLCNSKTPVFLFFSQSFSVFYDGQRLKKIFI